MRPIYTKSVIAAILCSPMVMNTSHASEWSGSYSSQGQCYCAGELPPDLSSKVVPTPVGGQTVSQVCSRIGKGPELLKASGLFNFPVYNDAQCGHGPFAEGSGAVDTNCAGSLDGNGTDCQGLGPKWDLAKAFVKMTAPAAAEPLVTDSKTTQSLIDQPVVSSVNVESNTGQGSTGGEKKVLRGTVIRSPSTAGRSFDPAQSAESSATAKAIAAFTGKTVTIGEQRYLQAHSGVSATGGASGSKIILDGLVFLREDGQLNTADLYQDQNAKKPSATPTIAQANETPPTPKSIVEKAASESHDDKDALSIRQANDAAALKKRETEEAARLAQKRETEKAARLAQKRETEKAARLAQKRETEKAQLLAEQKARLQSVDESVAQVKPAGSMDSESVADEDATSIGSTLLTALRMPPNTRQSSRNFNYLEAMPVSYDIGGAGVLLEGSGSSNSRIQYVGSLGFTPEYQEVMVGGGYFLTPADADRLTVVLVAGLEYGSFELGDSQFSVDFDDSGVYLGTFTRFVLNDRFELKGGIGYSSFFEGDAMIFGGGYYHLNRQLDVVSRFEVGDNDLLGIGVRYYY